jgi:hypothetical protein
MAVSVMLSAGVAVFEPAIQSAGPVSMVYYAILPVAVLALMHVLDRTADRALRTLGPLLPLTSEELARVHRELTVVPARPAVLLAIFGAFVTPIGYVTDPVGSGIVGLSAGGLFFRWFWESLVTAAFLTLIYHTLRQLRRIDRINAAVMGVDPFDQGPLYAMSQVTSGTAAGLLVLLAPSALLIPAGAEAGFLVITAFWYGLAVAVAFAAFFLPLRGMHARLAAEKHRLKGEVGRRFSATLGSMHAAMDACDGSAIETGTKALSALVAERDLVNRIPTWPWSTGALTGFVSAVLLPIGLWVATRILERLF